MTSLFIHLYKFRASHNHKIIQMLLQFLDEAIELTECSTLPWWRPISYRNQSTDLLCKSMDWFLYDIGLRRERVKWDKRKQSITSLSELFGNIYSIPVASALRATEMTTKLHMIYNLTHFQQNILLDSCWKIVRRIPIVESTLSRRTLPFTT